MRETYRLSPETRKTLTNRAGEFADEMDKADKYFYAILADTETDPFAKFLPFYAAACRLRVNCHWKAKLEATEARYAAFPEVSLPAECVREKISAHTRLLDKFIDLMGDGHLDAADIAELEPLAEDAARVVEKLQASLSFHRGLLEAEQEKRYSRPRVA